MKRSGTPSTRRTSRTSVRPASGEACGLCGKAGNVTKTECCGNSICDDEDSYVLFSYARNSCFRNHRRYTLCGSHATEEHAGSWQTCKKCRRDCATELYVYYGTNDYNFVKLENPPSFEPTLCSKCRKRIRLAEDGFTHFPDGRLFCERCAEAEDRRA